jgi:hypothetical protein
MTARYDPQRWDALEREAEQRLAEAGTTLAAFRASIENMPGAGTGEQLRQSAVQVAIAVGGPPAADEGLRGLAASLGLVLAPDATAAA